jgi:ADP-heptose:LPS heptosyltransferase
MGDCLLLTSPVRALKHEFPDFRVSVLVEPRFAGCFDGNPDLHEIIAASGKYRTGIHLLKRKFDAIINLHGGPTSLLYTWAARGRRIGREQYQYGTLYNGLLPAPKAEAHSVESTMAAFQWMGLRAMEAPPLRYEPHPLEAARMRQAAGRLPYGVVHPGALMATKRWDTRRFADLSRELIRLGLGVVLTCGPGEEEVVRDVRQGLADSVSLTGLSIPELAELIRGARLYIGNDSGPMHLAAAVGTPTVAIWGSSDWRRWRPWRVESRVVQNPFECNPCPGYRCLVADSPLCIESVTVEQVIAAVNELL